MYERLRNRRIGTNEIEAIARSITKNKGNKHSKRNSWHQNEVVRLLDLRIESLRGNLQMLERILKPITKTRINMLKKQHLLARTFVRTLREYVISDWQKGINKSNKKIQHLEKIYKKLKEVKPEVTKKSNDIKISDEVLKDWEHKNNLQPSDNYIVYGETILDDEEKDFMSLPAEHRLVMPSTRDEIENKAEQLAVKVRYDNINQVEYIDNVSDNPETQWYDDKTNQINFKNMRVTSFKTNGRIYAPKLGRRQDEMVAE